mgnify:FL=1
MCLVVVYADFGVLPSWWGSSGTCSWVVVASFQFVVEMGLIFLILICIISLSKTFVFFLTVPLSHSVLCYYRKQCIHSYDVYDFLKNVASKVPDLGAPDSSVDDKLGKRR